MGQRKFNRRHHPQHTKCGFSFAHLNVRSIMNKLDHFRILMSKKPFDVIMFERNVLR